MLFESDLDLGLLIVVEAKVNVGVMRPFRSDPSHGVVGGFGPADETYAECLSWIPQRRYTRSQLVGRRLKCSIMFRSGSRVFLATRRALRGANEARSGDT